jgi:hypothetical protein
MKKIFIVVSMLVLTFGIGVADANIINGGFETGNLSGWQSSIPSGGSASVVSNFDGYSPVEGSYFLNIKTDGPRSYTTVSQRIDLLSGYSLQGYAAWLGNDYFPFNDNAWVKIYNSSNTLVAYSMV